MFWLNPSISLCGVRLVERVVVITFKSHRRALNAMRLNDHDDGDDRRSFGPSLNERQPKRRRVVVVVWVRRIWEIKFKDRHNATFLCVCYSLYDC